MVRTTMARFRRDVPEKLNGGGVTRQKELLELQTKGKEKSYEFVASMCCSRDCKDCSMISPGEPCAETETSLPRSA